MELLRCAESRHRHSRHARIDIQHTGNIEQRHLNQHLTVGSILNIAGLSLVGVDRHSAVGVEGAAAAPHPCPGVNAVKIVLPGAGIGARGKHKLRSCPRPRARTGTAGEVYTVNCKPRIFDFLRRRGSRSGAVLRCLGTSRCRIRASFGRRGTPRSTFRTLSSGSGASAGSCRTAQRCRRRVPRRRGGFSRRTCAVAGSCGAVGRSVFGVHCVLQILPGPRQQNAKFIPCACVAVCFRISVGGHSAQIGAENIVIHR